MTSQLKFIPTAKRPLTSISEIPVDPHYKRRKLMKL